MSEYKVVPVEPTAEMMATGGIEMGARDEDARTVWKAMIAAAPAVQGEPSRKELYKEFSEWCQSNPSYDLDCRLHTHGGPIDRGGYISNEKTRVAFAAYRAGRLSAPQPAEQQPEDVESIWMYKGSDGEWKPFADEQHRLNTIADGGWDVREFFAAPNVQRGPDVTQLVDALEGVVSEIERVTCLHENTHRGGVLWEICEDCGAKWADDRGGKPEFSWPDNVEKARTLIAAHCKGGEV